MRIDIITLLPELIQSPFEASILQRAIQNELVEIHFHNPRDYATGNYRQVDDYAFGGGAGMVMMIEPLDRCIEELKSQREYQAVAYLTPDGKPWEQSDANSFSLFENIILLCGHYKGIDQRLRDHVITHEISIGDYVLSGGELAAAVVSDSIIRLIPGVMNDETSALTDSFQDGLLAPPVYTRPTEYKDWKVPEILLSGNTPKIDAWREEQALKRTQERRPDLLDKE